MLPSRNTPTHEILGDDTQLSSKLLGVVNPKIDLAPHPSNSAGDSFYIVSYLRAKDKDGKDAGNFTVLFDLLALSSLPISLLGVSVLDENSGTYYPFNEITYGRKIDNSSLKDGRLDIKIIDSNGSEANGRLSGTLETGLTVTGHFLSSNGGKDLCFKFTMNACGPMLNYLGEGVIPFANGIDYEFALPSMMTTNGSLTLEGKTYTVEGDSWLDRQWGYLGDAQWTWMCIDLDNGVRMAVWDQASLDPSSNDPNQPCQSFATILDNNDHLIATTAEIKGNTVGKYPGSWTVTIPGYADKLIVTRMGAGPDNYQELGPNGILRMEARCSVGGRYNETDVKGKAFVEVGRLDLQALATLLNPTLPAQAAVAQKGTNPELDAQPNGSAPGPPK